MEGSLSAGAAQGIPRTAERANPHRIHKITFGSEETRASTDSAADRNSGAVGIRVRETQYITVQAAEAGRTDIRLKGKIRTILLPKELCRKLLKYARKQKSLSARFFLPKEERDCRVDQYGRN